MAEYKFMTQPIYQGSNIEVGSMSSKTLIQTGIKSDSKALWFQFAYSLTPTIPLSNYNPLLQIRAEIKYKSEDLEDDIFFIIINKEKTDAILELVGNTPLLELSRFSKMKGLATPLVAKLEYFNQAGSVKDRVALSLVEDAERRGVLTQGGTIIEPTSGNTGIGLAMVAAVKGYHLILTMPETMSVERRKLLKAYGAEIVLTPGVEGMSGAIAEAERLKNAMSGAVILQQFENPANVEAHCRTTAQEIWNDTGGKIDIFVACVGTGGTITGIGRVLKVKNPSVRIVAVEPASSPVLSGGKPGAHKIQGIGAGFVPKIYDSNVVDEIVAIADDDAFQAGRSLAMAEGVLVGISSGAALAAAVDVASRPENEDKRVVILLPDTGERYLSTDLFL